VTARAGVVGINHVALEVGDVDEALDFYGRMFEFAIRERSDEHALIWRVTKCWRC
jgi:catechol 2,3-dioxygenase-like lactoylglutathione lyase family enzyme